MIDNDRGEDVEIERLRRIPHSYMDIHSFFNPNYYDFEELFSTITRLEDQNSFTPFRAIKEFIFSILYVGVQFDSVKDSKVAFFYTPSYMGRANNLDDFKKVLSCCSSFSAFIGIKKKHFPKWIIKCFITWLRWIKSIHSKEHFSVPFCVHLANQVVIAEYFLLLVNKCSTKELRNYLACVTYCDVHISDYIITKLFNDVGVKTVTLQHALYEHSKYGFENLYSHSTVVLSISELSNVEAKLAGADVSKYRIVGPMKFISQTIPKSVSIIDSKSVGIALSGPHFKVINEELIDFARKMKREYGYECILRLHPALDKEQYTRLCNEENMFLDSSKTMQEFASNCVFTIMGPTNVFGDLIALGSIAFRMDTEGDFYSQIDGLKFSNWKDLKNMIDNLRHNPNEFIEEINTVRNMVCPLGDIKDNYTSFFNQF